MPTSARIYSIHVEKIGKDKKVVKTMATAGSPRIAIQSVLSGEFRHASPFSDGMRDNQIKINEEFVIRCRLEPAYEKEGY